VPPSICRCGPFTPGMVHRVGPAHLPRPSASTDAGGPGSIPHISDEELLADFRRYEGASGVRSGVPASVFCQSRCS